MNHNVDTEGRYAKITSQTKQYTRTPPVKALYINMAWLNCCCNTHGDHTGVNTDYVSGRITHVNKKSAYCNLKSNRQKIVVQTCKYSTYNLPLKSTTGWCNWKFGYIDTRLFLTSFRMTCHPFTCYIRIGFNLHIIHFLNYKFVFTWRWKC